MRPLQPSRQRRKPLLMARRASAEPATMRGEGETEQHLVEAVFIVELEDEGTHPRRPGEEGGVNEREEEAGDAARKEQGHRGRVGRSHSNCQQQ